MKPVSLDAIRPSLEGVIPATVATCSADGVPNATYVSQMQYVDARHVALSFQFFNKTRENVLANPYATVLMIDPRTIEYWRLHLHYLAAKSVSAVCTFAVNFTLRRWLLFSGARVSADPVTPRSSEQQT